MQTPVLLKKSATPLKPGFLVSRGLSLLIVLFWGALVIIPLMVLSSVALKSPVELLNNPLVARFTGPWSQRIYIYFVAGLIVPLQLGLFPLYKEMHDLQLINTYYGVILLYIAVNLPFVIFLYTSFIKTVPRELEEAALLDGAGPMQIFWLIVFPLLTPVTATVAITSALSTWNDFFIPLIFLQRDGMQTLPLAIFNFVGQYNNNWPLIFASVIISSLPLIVLFLVLQRYFIKGITAGALRG